MKKKSFKDWKKETSLFAKNLHLIKGGALKRCKWTDPETGDEISGFCEEIDVNG